MSDLEQVIKGLECIISSGNAGMRNDCANCIYPGGGDCLAPALQDALTLLKAQEIRPIIGKIHNEDGSTNYYLHCPFDGTVIDVGDRFCRKCGRPVKWE